MFSVTTVNTDRSLLTTAELRAAATVTDGSQDAELTALGNRIAASITKACRVVADGATPPTLRLEAVSDTYRLRRSQPSLLLSRRPITTVASVTENDVALDSADYEIDAASGILYRLSSDVRACWPCGKIVVAYSAGWQTVPDDLKFAAIKFVQAQVQQGSRDPLLKREVVPGVIEREYWVDPTKEVVIPAEVMDLLERGDYVNYTVA